MLDHPLDRGIHICQHELTTPAFQGHKYCNILLGPAMLDHCTLWVATSGTALWPFKGWPSSARAVSSRLTTLLDNLCHTDLISSDFLYVFCLPS
jgi:hypothetical protein